jgi:predicted nucleic acid-binding protein
MTRYVLDSTFLIDHLRSTPAAMTRLDALYAAGDDPIVSDVTTAEVWSGRRDDVAEEIERFLQYFEYVHPGPATGRLAGEFRARARANGRTLDIPDALIAATAMDLDAIVLTRNVRDFELTPVRVESY